MLNRVLLGTGLSVLLASSLSAFTLTPARPTAPVSYGPGDVSSPAQAIVTDGAETIVFWLEENGEWPNVVRTSMATRVSAAGELREPVALGEMRGAGAFTAERTADDRFLLAWPTFEGVFIAPVDRSMRMGEARRISDGYAAVDLACNDVRCVAAVASDAGLDLHPLASDASAAGAPVRLSGSRPSGVTLGGSGATFLLSLQATGMEMIGVLELLDADLESINRRQEGFLWSIAADRGGRYVAASHERLLLFDGDATPLAERPIDLRNGNRFTDQVVAAASEDGYAVGALAHNWQNFGIPAPPPPNNFFLARFRRDLTPIDDEPIAVMGWGHNNIAGIAANGSTYFAAWTHKKNTARAGVVEAFPAAGEPSSWPRFLRIGPLDQRPLAISRSATGALALWRETHVGAADKIKAALLTHDGTPGELLPTEIGESGGFGSVVAGSDGRNYLVAWHVPTDDTLGSFQTVLVDGLTGEVRTRQKFRGRPGKCIASDGTSFFLPVNRGSHLVVARFAATGDFVSEFTVETASYPYATLDYSDGTLLVGYDRTDGGWARAFSRDGVPMNDAIDLPGQWNTIIVADAEGFKVARSWGWFSKVSRDGRLVATHDFTASPSFYANFGAALNGYAVFFGTRAYKGPAVVFLGGPWTAPRAAEVEIDFHAIASDPDGRGSSLLLLSQQEINGVLRVVTQQGSLSNPLRRRAVQR